MSGTEAITLFSLISSILQLVQATKQIYNTAHDIQGYPEAFREVAKRLPLIEESLGLVQESVDVTSCAIIEPVMKTCEDRATRLKQLFDDVVSKDGAPRMGRYMKALRTLGKGNKVESLTEQILQDLHLLADRYTFEVSAKLAELAAAINELQKVPPSAPDEIFDGAALNVHNGSGPQNVNWGSIQSMNLNTGRGSQFVADKLYYGTK